MLVGRGGGGRDRRSVNKIGKEKREDKKLQLVFLQFQLILGFFKEIKKIVHVLQV